MATLRYISDKLFHNMNFSTSRANNSRTIFFKDLTFPMNQFHADLNLILNVNLYNDILMFPLTFPKTSGGCIRS